MYLQLENVRNTVSKWKKEGYSVGLTLPTMGFYTMDILLH